MKRHFLTNPSNVLLALIFTVILSTSYLLDGLSEIHTAQDVADEAKWTENGNLICRLQKAQLQPLEPLTVAQAGRT